MEIDENTNTENAMSSLISILLQTTVYKLLTILHTFFILVRERNED